MEYRLAKLYGRAVLRWTKMRVIVSGADKVANLKRYAVVSNHASYLDFAVLLGYFPAPLRFIAKQGLKFMPAIGRHLIARGILIDRKDRQRALQAIEAAILDDDLTPILIFAEGTRSDDGKPQRFKRGGLSLLAKHGVTMVPVTILNTYNHLPKGAISYRAGGELRMIIAQPLLRENFQSDEAMIDAVEACIHKTFLAG
jgi:1-acyl-sn-glycerol-3-phosphate acyltransferase